MRGAASRAGLLSADRSSSSTRRRAILTPALASRRAAVRRRHSCHPKTRAGSVYRSARSGARSRGEREAASVVPPSESTRSAPTIEPRVAAGAAPAGPVAAGDRPGCALTTSPLPTTAEPLTESAIGWLCAVPYLLAAGS